MFSLIESFLVGICLSICWDIDLNDNLYVLGIGEILYIYIVLSSNTLLNNLLNSLILVFIINEIIFVTLLLIVPCAILGYVILIVTWLPFNSNYFLFNTPYTSLISSYNLNFISQYLLVLISLHPLWVYYLSNPCFTVVIQSIMVTFMVINLINVNNVSNLSNFSLIWVMDNISFYVSGNINLGILNLCVTMLGYTNIVKYSLLKSWLLDDPLLLQILIKILELGVIALNFNPCFLILWITLSVLNILYTNI